MGLEDTLLKIVFGTMAIGFVIVVILSGIEDMEKQKMEDVCWNHGFSDIVYYNGDWSSLGHPFCCDTHETNCKPFLGVEKHKWYGELCDFLFECVELRRTK